MKTMILSAIVLLLTSSLAFATEEGGKKRVDVDPVDVPEKMVVQPTTEELHEETTLSRTCASCHVQGDLEAEPKPLNHFQTTRDCNACHFSKQWVPLRFYSHLTGKYRPNATPDDCRSCHFSNSEHLAR